VGSAAAAAAAAPTAAAAVAAAAVRIAAKGGQSLPVSYLLTQSKEALPSLVHDHGPAAAAGVQLEFAEEISHKIVALACATRASESVAHSEVGEVGHVAHATRIHATLPRVSAAAAAAAADTERAASVVHADWHAPAQAIAAHRMNLGLPVVLAGVANVCYCHLVKGLRVSGLALASAQHADAADAADVAAAAAAADAADYASSLESSAYSCHAYFPAAKDVLETAVPFLSFLPSPPHGDETETETSVQIRHVMTLPLRHQREFGLEP